MSEELNTVPAAGLETVRNIETITTEILFYSQQAGTAIIEIGNRLLEAKSQLDHGEWLPWLTERVKFSERTAQRLMKLAEGYSKSDTVTDLGTGKALALLALNPAEREEFIAEKHVAGGKEKTVDEMSKKELETAIRERKAAQEAERAAINRADAMESQLTKEREKLKQEEERKKALSEELENLKAQPIPEPTGPSDEELDKIRKNAEKEAKKKAEARISAAKDEADKKVVAAQEKVKQLETEVDQAHREAGQTKEQLEKAKKAATVNGDAELATAKVHFQNAQSAINNLQECIDSLRKSGNENRAAGLSRALTAVCDAAKAAVSA